MELKGGDFFIPKPSTLSSSPILHATQLTSLQAAELQTALPLYDLQAAAADSLLLSNKFQGASLQSPCPGLINNMSNKVTGGGVPASPQLESFLSSYLNLPSFGSSGDYFSTNQGISNPVVVPQTEEYLAAGISLLSKPCYGTEQLLVEGTKKGQKMTHHEQQEMMGGKKRKRGKGGVITDDHQYSDHHYHQVGIEKPKEVIHVRAKRGQATDSHSLAERVRRERINEKLRVLQDLVPGCYKTMGMAVMLDVIINYVQSLQNQIEFLSMKLSAASMFYDFNSPEAEAVEALQLRTNNCEAREMERTQQQQQQHHHQGHGHGHGHGHGGGGEGGGLFSPTVDGDNLPSMWRF